MSTINGSRSVDLLTHSPDGESRGLIARVGDVFPLDPTVSIHAVSEAPPSSAATRPWGLRLVQTPESRSMDSDT